MGIAGRSGPSVNNKIGSDMFRPSRETVIDRLARGDRTSGLNLVRADLSDTRLVRADLSKSNLRMANL
jgi:uncharacterized protein YjbI with pentapeptide repeats